MSSIADQTLPGPAPAYALFDANSVGLATLFGGPVAGSFLMALNYRRLELTGNAVVVQIIGIIVTGFAILVGWNLPKNVTVPLALALLVGTKWMAQSLQGATVKYHVEHGGRLGSRWTAFGSGVGFMAALFAVAFFTVFKSTYASTARNSVMIGSKDEVYYSGSATRQDAQSLGDALKTRGYFTDRGADVFLSKGADGTIVSFVVNKDYLSQPGIMDSFEEVGRQVAPVVGGFPIQVRLIDSAREVKQESTVGEAVFPGNDAVYYLGTVKQSEAQALGQALKSTGYFEGKGSDVFLSKHKDGTALSFVVSDGAWNKPAIVSDFEKITRQAAPSVGGLPIKVRLVNTSLEIKKDQMVQ
ncbi:MAG TPA: hypothetical protein VHX63_13240 [Acidobacteriaceae bacterium]|jgi:hypothetical protein|nr:hypothetical protein [Acidobacteriaceae bacterium]